MARKEPNHVDIHVGARLKMRRMIAGMSQEKLGESLGLTFQQVQKYEKGTNRIGASRLWEIAQVLNTPVSYFYDGLHTSADISQAPHAAGGLQEEAASSMIVDFLSTSDGLHLNKAFLRVRDPRVRRKLVELVRTLAGEDDSV